MGTIKEDLIFSKEFLVRSSKITWMITESPNKSIAMIGNENFTLMILISHLCIGIPTLLEKLKIGLTSWHVGPMEPLTMMKTGAAWAKILLGLEPKAQVLCQNKMWQMELKHGGLKPPKWDVASHFRQLAETLP